MSDEVAQIIAYPLADEATLPVIKPAGRVRDWQLKTTESFATRCLPLNMANNHGWELSLPGGFDAIYHGGDYAQNIEIYPHGDGPCLGVSHFGFGVLTFHVNCLFRSPVGVHLQFQGPVNEVKDGIQALSGLIETDWSPYSTTMNWKFTRPGRVRFIKGESFAQIAPVPARYVERFSARFGDLAEESPEVKADFDQWRSSRNEILRDRYSANTEDREVTAENLYYRGYYPDGKRKYCEHATRLAPAQFDRRALPQTRAALTGAPISRHPVTCVIVVNVIDWRLDRLLDDLSDKAGQVIVCCQYTGDQMAALQLSVRYTNVEFHAVSPAQSLAQFVQRQATHDTVLLMESTQLVLTPFWQNLPLYLAKLASDYSSISLPLCRARETFISRAALQTASTLAADLLEPLNQSQAVLVPTHLLESDYKLGSFAGEDWLII